MSRAEQDIADRRAIGQPGDVRQQVVGQRLPVGGSSCAEGSMDVLGNAAYLDGPAHDGNFTPNMHVAHASIMLVGERLNELGALRTTR